MGVLSEKQKCILFALLIWHPPLCGFLGIFVVFFFFKHNVGVTILVSKKGKGSSAWRERDFVIITSLPKRSYITALVLASPSRALRYRRSAF